MNPFPEIHDFLGCPTQNAWVEQALCNQDLLLIDHANCEKKAAACALQLIHCYPHHHELLQKMARLAREELLHFQKVAKLLKSRRIAYQPLRPGRYAQALRDQVRTSEPRRLMDFLIIGAFIEARSCERFLKIIQQRVNMPHFHQLALASSSHSGNGFIIRHERLKWERSEEHT